MSGFNAVNGPKRHIDVSDSSLPGSPGSQQQQPTKRRSLRRKLDPGHSNLDEGLQSHLEKVGQALDEGWRLSLDLQRKGQSPINKKRELSDRLLKAHGRHKDLTQVYKYQTKQEYHTRLTTHLDGVQELIQWIRANWMTAHRLTKSKPFVKLNGILDGLEKSLDQALAEYRKRTSGSRLPDIGDSFSRQSRLPLYPSITVHSDGVGTDRTTEGTSVRLGSNNSIGGSPGGSLADLSAQWQRSKDELQATLAELTARLSAWQTLHLHGTESTRQ